MADDNKTKFVLDLDIQEFSDNALKAKGMISSLGNAELLEGLLEGLGKMGTMAGVIGVAYLGLKSTLEAVFEAEGIKQVNAAFEQLSESVGIVSEELKKGLLDASGGMVDEVTLLRSANAAMVEMGGSAAQLPQLMELARKSTAVFGGDLMSNFDQMNKAIASGNTRILKHMGIIIDTDAAYRKFAASQGIAVDALSQAGKSQAILNAVLDEGGKSLSGVNLNITEAKNTWQELKATVTEVKDTFVLVFEKTVGPTVRNVLGGLRDAAKELKKEFTATFGEGSEQAKAQSEQLSAKLALLKTSLAELQEPPKGFFATMGRAFGGETQEQIKRTQEEIKKTEAELERLHQNEKRRESDVSKGVSTTSPKSGPAKRDRSPADQRKQLELEAKFQQDMLKLQQERYKEYERMNKSLVQQDAIAAQQRLSLEQDHQAKVKKIQNDNSLSNKQKDALILQEDKNLHVQQIALDEQNLERKKALVTEQISLTDSLDQYEQLKQQQAELVRQEYDQRRKMIQQNELMDEQQKKDAILQTNQMEQMELNQLFAEKSQERIAILDRETAHAQGAANAFATGFENASRKSAENLSNFGNQGAMVFGMLTNHLESMFVQFGEGSKKGTEIMRQEMFGLIADIAQYYGAMMLAAGIFPPNPPAIAGGAALLVLSGYLRARSRGAGPSFGGSFGFGGGAGVNPGGALGDGLDASSDNLQQTHKKKHAVHVEIHGNVFETDHTRTKIAEIVREAADATDFRISRVGSSNP